MPRYDCTRDHTSPLTTSCLTTAHPQPTIQCDYKRVRDELNKFSDYDLHQICTQYPDKLKPLELLPEDLYSSQKMIKVRPLSNPYLAPI